MQHGAEEKSQKLSLRFGRPPSDQQLQVYVAVEEQVDRFVPFAVELFIGRRVPPILIESAIVQLGDFSEYIGHELKN